MPNNDDLINEFTNREIETLEILLAAKADRASISLNEYIDSRVAQGASLQTIEQDLIDDLLNNGRIFSEFRNAVRATVIGSVNRVRDSQIFIEEGVEAEYSWIAILVNTCPDCLELHGQSKTYAEWEDFGLPRTGITVCKENCRCMLIPSKIAVIDPIQRSRK